MESLLEAGKVGEVAPHLRITWGSAIHHARFKALECGAMSEIAQGKLKLVLARTAKASISAGWAVGAGELID